MTARPNPAELNDEHHTLIDAELGRPGRRWRRDAAQQEQLDRDALTDINAALCCPQSASDRLDRIGDIVRDTGRPVGGRPIIRLAG